MAQECGFFNAQLVGDNEYDRVYLAEQFAAYFASFIGTGIFGKSMQKLEVLAQTEPNMSIKVLPGEAWINGWWYRNTEEYTLSLDVADGVLSRIDVIVLRWGNQERDMWLHVIKGNASSNPVAPKIERNADYYDLQLATVAMSKGTIKITQSAIEDTRLATDVCGLVTGVVDQIDTTGLYNQFQAYFEEFKEYYEKDYANWTDAQKAEYAAFVEQMGNDYTAWTDAEKEKFEEWYNSHTDQWSTEFNYWFNNVKQQLSGDIAYQLSEEIVKVDEKVDGYVDRITTFSDDGKTITQVSGNQKIITIFEDQYHIIQDFYVDNVKVKTESITFSPDGKVITESKEVD